MVFRKILKVFKKIVDIIGYVVLALLVAMTAFVFISNARGEAPFFGKYSVLFVLTDSMEPTIPEQSSILVEKTDPNTLNVGDIIVFISEDPAIKGMRNTHRIVEINEDHTSFTTKGDHNLKNDEYPVSAAAVVGKHVRNLPIVTRFARLLSQETGYAMVAVMVLLILMVIYLPDMKRTEKKQAEEQKKQHDDLIDEMVKKEVERLMSADADIKREAEARMKAAAEKAAAEKAGAVAETKTETAVETEAKTAAETKTETAVENAAEDEETKEHAESGEEV